MRGNIVLGLSACVIGIAVQAGAAVRTEVVNYRHGKVALEGFLAWDDAGNGARPGVLVFPDWKGIGGFSRDRAQALARLGYVAFVADMYGKGVRPKTQKAAAAQADLYRKDRLFMRARARAGFDVLAANQQADSKRLAAIGFCFGGGVALELARSGAELAGVVSFHGNLDTPNLEDGRNIKGQVLILHGADDSVVRKDQVMAFWAEMRRARVRWQMNVYGLAVHAFTDPASGNDLSKGMAYNETAARRSWRAMEDFFDEIFRVKKGGEQ